jgi:hypothetical protein
MSRERRPLFLEEEPSAEPGRYGCPMLVRTRFFLSADAARPVMRCSLGWALHGELDVARCRVTESVTDCWKVHPERTPVVVLTGTDDERPDGGARVASHAESAKVAGD